MPSTYQGERYAIEFTLQEDSSDPYTSEEGAKIISRASAEMERARPWNLVLGRVRKTELSDRV